METKLENHYPFLEFFPLKSDLLEDGNFGAKLGEEQWYVVKIRPLGGWKYKCIELSSSYPHVKIRPLGGWK